MSNRRVYLLLITGDAADAHAFIARNYPDHECVVLSRRELRGVGWREQIRAFRALQGQAIVFFLRRMSDLQEPRLTLCAGIWHHCHSTIVADAEGNVHSFSRLRLLGALPGTLASALSDLFVLGWSWFFLVGLRYVKAEEPTAEKDEPDFDLAYLYPYPLDTAQAGGALSHVEGFLSGAAALGSRCEIYSGRALPAGKFPLQVIPAKWSWFLFRESLLLLYNVRFARAVKAFLQRRRPSFLYQRHGRFVVAGAMLSRRLGIPLILEYNGSEVFVSEYWNASRFQSWLRACEEVAIREADQIVVVSEPLRQELMDRGVPKERIVLNPNGVDPEFFRPGCGGLGVRAGLGIAPSDIVVGFVGSFDLWHGMYVLADAIRDLLTARPARKTAGNVKFLLVGDGALYPEIRQSLQSYVGESVFFAGVVPHHKVPAYLDAADILVSPHVPMPDGRRFFGSPTKLFEYMAMGKAIVASNLDQLSEVLEHGRSALLVPPGNASALTAAMLLLAQDSGLRSRLGESARDSAVARHTWKQNAARVLKVYSSLDTTDADISMVARSK